MNPLMNIRCFLVFYRGRLPCCPPICWHNRQPVAALDCKTRLEQGADYARVRFSFSRFSGGCIHSPCPLSGIFASCRPRFIPVGMVAVWAAAREMEDKTSESTWSEMFIGILDQLCYSVFITWGS